MKRAKEMTMKEAASTPIKVAYPIDHKGPATVIINESSSLHRVSVVIAPPRVIAFKK